MTGMTNVTKLASEPSGQEFLVFTLGDEEYGIDILKVQEIRGYVIRHEINEGGSVR